MRLYVLKSIKLKKAGRVFDVSPGAIVEIEKPEKAKTLINSGHVRPLLSPDIAGKLQAARIFLKILDEEVWVVTHPDALSLVPEGVIVYLPEEIRNLRGATPEEIRTMHKVKKEFGGKLLAVNQRGEG